MECSNLKNLNITAYDVYFSDNSLEDKQMKKETKHTFNELTNQFKMPNFHLILIRIGALRFDNIIKWSFVTRHMNEFKEEKTSSNVKNKNQNKNENEKRPMKANISFTIRLKSSAAINFPKNHFQISFDQLQQRWFECR